MDVLRIPFEFRVDLDYGRAAHNSPGAAPIDNPGTPSVVPKLIASRRRGLTTIHDNETKEQFLRGVGKRFRLGGIAKLRKDELKETKVL